MPAIGDQKPPKDTSNIIRNTAPAAAGPIVQQAQQTAKQIEPKSAQIKQQAEQALKQIEPQIPQIQKQAEQALKQIEPQIPQIQKQAEQALRQIEPQIPQIQHAAQQAAQQIQNDPAVQQFVQDYPELNEPIIIMPRSVGNGNNSRGSRNNRQHQYGDGYSGGNGNGPLIYNP